MILAKVTLARTLLPGSGTLLGVLPQIGSHHIMKSTVTVEGSLYGVNATMTGLGNNVSELAR